MAEIFPDISVAFREGRITESHVDGWLDAIGLEGEARAIRRAAVVKPDGTLVQFQVVGLHRAVRDATRDAEVAAEIASPATAVPAEKPLVIPEQFLRDVPEAVYDEPLPDLAAEIKKRLGIIAGVRMFGKPQDRIRDARTEGIKVRCPFPDHEDFDPSAWVNTEKNTWYCGKCVIGGDVIDFYAARKHRLAPKDFHRSPRFNEVVRELGAEIGLTVVRRGKAFEIEDEGAPMPSPLPDAPRGEEGVTPRSVPDEADQPDYLPDPTGGPPEPVVPPSHEAAEPITVTTDDVLRGVSLDDDLLDDFADDIDDEEKPAGVKGVRWRDLEINPGSFLGEWMKYQEEFLPWVPPEYFLFAGFQAVGLACGHFVTSFTGATLTGSLMLTMIGSSGGGKSTAVSELRKMLGRVAGPKFDPDLGTGVKVIPSPASSEALIKSIYTDIEDIGHVVPGTRKEVGVTAWLYEDEFATFVERARRRGGGTLKTRLIQLYDFTKSKDDMEVVLEEYSIASGLRTVSDSYFCAMFTTQTDAIRGLMERTDLISGFLNRIIPVFGVARMRRSLVGMPSLPTDPEHDKSYRHLWDRCRRGKKMIPFTDEALLFADEHPFLRKIERMAASDSLYSRVQHMTLRLAFLIAVNNGESEVELRYVNAACELVSTYLMSCFAALRRSVIATDMDDLSERVLQFVKRFYKNHNKWPSQAEWCRDRSYKSSDSMTRIKALDALFTENRLVRIKLVNGRATQQVFLIPDGEWSEFATCQDKKYNYADFYGAPA